MSYTRELVTLDGLSKKCYQFTLDYHGIYLHRAYLATRKTKRHKFNIKITWESWNRAPLCEELVPPPEVVGAVLKEVRDRLAYITPEEYVAMRNR